MTDLQPADHDPQYGIGPFTLRELILLGVWVLAFIVSFFPLGGFGTSSVWTSGLGWILAIGVPTAAVGLIVLRRFSPDGIRRVGSLGVDQFASVAFSVAALVWLQIVWAEIAAAIDYGGFPGSWVSWVELVLMLGGVALTVFAPLIPVVCEDFQGRREVPAHRYARPVRPVAARPAAERAPKPAKEPKPPREPKPAKEPKPSRVPAAQGYDPQSTGAQGYDPQAGPDPFAVFGADADEAAPYTPVDTLQLPTEDGSRGPQQRAAQQQPAAAQQEAQPQPAAAAQQEASPQPVSQQTQQQPVSQQPASAQQAFWALAPVERDVVDQHGVPLFRIGPTAWALVIEDRGSAFVVRDEDGRTGFLTDVSGVMRG